MTTDSNATARPSKRGWHIITSNILMALIPIFCLVYILDFHTRFGVTFYREQYLSLFIALFLSSIFLSRRAYIGLSAKKSPPWYDILLAILAVVIFGRVAIFYEDMMILVGFAPWSVAIWGLIAVLLILEAVRRIIGLPLVIIAIIFIFYARFAYLAPGLLSARGVSWNRLFTFLYLDNNSLLGVPAGVAGTMVVGFLFFGSCLFMVGGGDFLSDLALSLMGRQRGGAAKVAVIASGMFGSLSGSASANVAVTGTVTIPLMIRTGYRPHFAGAVEASASTGGLVLPPVMGITAFMMSEFLGIPYYQVALGAAIPAILYYVAMLTQVHFEAVRTGITGLPPEEIPSLKAVLKKGWIYFIPILGLFYFLFWEHLDPGASAMYAAILMLIVGMIKPENRKSFSRKIKESFIDSGRQVLVVGAACTSAGIVIGSVALTNLGISLSNALIHVSGGNSFILLVLAALGSIVLGMGMPIAATYTMLAILIVPALQEIGMNAFASHMFLNFFAAMSFVTPPVCIAAFVAAGIAKCNFMQCGWTATRLSIAAYLVPFAFCYSTGLLFIGSPGQIIFSAAAATIGVLFVAIGLSGYLWKNLNIGIRSVAVIGGLFMFFPHTYIVIAGAIINLAITAWQIRYRTSLAEVTA